VLGQIFEDAPGELRRVKVGLPAWFANLLPEGELRRYLERELGPGRISDYELLCRLGQDLPGDVTVHAERFPVSDYDEADVVGLKPDHPLRPSIAGVQLKFSFSSNRLTFPASGKRAWWIAKLPDRSLPMLPKNEYATMQWLHAAGLDVPLPRLVEAGTVPDLPEGLVEAEESVYLIPRFDRNEHGRVHVEDFAQIADVPPQFKYREPGVTYDSLGLTIKRLTGDVGFAEYVRRLAAMVIVGNTDAHLKNWSIIYPDGRTPALAPVYDFHSLTVYSRYRHMPLALRFAGEEMVNLITISHFEKMAETVGADKDVVQAIVTETVAALRETWRDVRAWTEDLFPPLARHLEQRLTSLPLCQG